MFVVLQVQTDEPEYVNRELTRLLNEIATEYAQKLDWRIDYDYRSKAFRDLTVPKLPEPTIADGPEKADTPDSAYAGPSSPPPTPLSLTQILGRDWFFGN